VIRHPSLLNLARRILMHFPALKMRMRRVMFNPQVAYQISPVASVKPTQSIDLNERFESIPAGSVPKPLNALEMGLSPAAYQILQELQKSYNRADTSVSPTLCTPMSSEISNNSRK